MLSPGSAQNLPPLLGTCGIDEAGRGPLAGPVYAAAVLLPPDFPLEVLADSKVLSLARREAAFDLIASRALGFAIDWASPAEIDERNILGASLLAMSRAWSALLSSLEARGLALPERVIIDGNRLPALERCPEPDAHAVEGIEARTLVKGDSLVPAVMAASIAAKVARDRAMERFDWLYPEYGYSKHKGYPTLAHRRLVLVHGPSPIQRRAFRVRVGENE